MLTIQLTFPGGRYHATPWNRHVNEGIPEWPPSPWRLLRALIATWRAKAPDVEDSKIAELVEQLSTSLPHYKLPASTVAHSRHYMPKYKAKTTKVFDTWVHVGKEAPIIMQWPGCELTDESESLLERLLALLGYLGRAESWVEAQIVKAYDGELNTVPLAASSDDDDVDVVDVLAPLPASEYVSWRAGEWKRALDRRLAEKKDQKRAKNEPPDEAKITKTDRRKVKELLPESLLEALHVETTDIRKQGWNQAPGSRWVRYVRPRDSLSPAPQRIRSRTADTRVPVARYVLASKAPPSLKDMLLVTEAAHKALVDLSDGLPVFTGKKDGRPMKGHRHAFVLPEANRHGGRLSHLTVFAPAGFDAAARAALEKLQRLWSKDGYEYRLVLLGVGDPEDLGGMNIDAGQCPLVESSTRWISRTPFVPTRHPKSYRDGTPKHDDAYDVEIQIGSPEHDLRRLIRARGLPEPTEVSPRAHTAIDGRPTSWLEFRTVRKRGRGRRADNRGYGFEITFGEEVAGPLAFGYGAHFGLGLFAPAGVYDGASDPE